MPAAAAADPVIAAAGDVACSSSSSNFNGGNGTADRCRMKYTSDLLVNAGLSAVLVLGDAQYESGSLSGFRNSYDLSWGRVKSITRPAAGNHEYKTSGAAGYFDYFNGTGVQTGPAGDRSKGYYSYNVGTWHLIALNSTDHCTIIPCGAGSAQEQWLKADLAANSDKYCTLAYWHDPRFNSGHDGNADEMAALFKALYDADADVVLGGHAHDYERFAPQNPSGQLDNARGIRQFVVGTGGAFWTSVGTPKPNSQIRQNSTYGVLKLTLRPTSYDFAFTPEAGKSFTDSGTGQCHGSTPPPPTDTTKPSIPGNLRATASAGQVALAWNASTDNVGVTGYKVYRGGTEIASVDTTTSYTDTNVAPNTTYSYTVRAVDAAGNLSDPSNTASATTPTATTFTFAPEADAQVNAAAPTTNYATAKLRTDFDSTPEDSFLRFTVSGLGASVGSAKLRLFAYTDSVDGPAVYTTSNTWNETTINWNTKPLRTSAARDDKGAIPANSWVEWDVTPFVTGNGTYSFTLAQSVSDGVDYRSREYTTVANRPQLVITTAAADTTKPSPPGNLTATPGAGQVALAWEAASDNVGVTGYRVFRGTTQIASLGTTARSYTDTGLAPGGYSYTVRAVDAAGNLSDPSNTAGTTVADTTKPTVPGNLTATPGPGQVALSWQASSDNVAVTGYRIFRGTDQVGSVAGGTTSFTDTGLAPGSYSYTVRAVDAAGNVSDPSNSAGATVTDTTKPTAPGGLAATPGPGQVALSWNGSTDDVGVTGYRVFRGTTQIASLGTTARSYTDTGLAAGSYSYTVRAVDAAGNLSDPSNTASATVPDTIKPTAPGNLSAIGSAHKVDLTWEGSTDDVAVTAYRVYRGEAEIATVGATARSYTDNGLRPGDYTYTVRALDAAGNLSDPSNAATGTVPDKTKPTAPSNLTATDNGPAQVDLAWEESTDDVAITDYRVYRDGQPVANVGTTPAYSDPVLPGTYTYEVRALDAADNMSDPSNTATATVAPLDLEAPAAPANLTATHAGSGQIDLVWEAASDNVGVTGYEVYRGETLIATLGATTSFSETLPPGTYTYTVRALDGAGNRSDPSGPADGTVPDTTKPTAPANLTATAVSPSQIDLSWDAASDNVAVTGYEIWRDGALLATIAPGTTYSDGVLAPATHTYEVLALDAAGNRSDRSNSASATVTPPDLEAPSPPAGLTAAVTPSGDVELSWEAATDNVGVAGYHVYRDGSLLTELGASTSHTDTAVPLGFHSYEVRALDGAGNASDPSGAAEVTVTDTQRPDAPANLTATAVSSSQIDLSWDAATDNVAVTEYEIWRDDALLTTIGTETSYSDSVLAPATHTYEVRAKDAAGNVSDPSNSDTATVTPPDTENPTPPANLAASVTGTGAVELTWDASLDNVGVTGYSVYRDGQPLAAVGATTSYTDASVAPGTYSYTVRAEDAAGNQSDPSAAADAVVPDTQPPTVPGNLTATYTGAGQVDLAWDASADNVLVTGYTVYRGTEQIATLGAATSFTDTGRGPGDYSYTVRALDAAGNVSDPSAGASVTVPDTSNPTAPANLSGNAPGPGQVDLAWDPSSDDVGVTGYRVYRDGAAHVTLGNVSSYSDTSVAETTTYSYEVRALDGAGNESTSSNIVSVTTPSASQQLTFSAQADARVEANTPTNNYGTSYLRADGGASVTESFLRFDVTGAVGTVRSAKLRLYVNSGSADGPAVFTTNTAWDENTITWDTRPARTSGLMDDMGAMPVNTWVEYDVTQLVRGNGTFSFGLAASGTDGTNFNSRESPTEPPELVVSTGPPDTEPPSAPSGLAWSAPAPNRVDLTWQPATDDVALGGYRIFRNNAPYATVGNVTSYSDTGVVGSSSYSYKVRALDLAGNISEPSNEVIATTPAGAAVMTFAPEADARVNAGAATTNYATTKLRTDFDSTPEESFLRFAVSGVPGAVSSAKLRVFAYTDSADGPAVYTTENSWSETTINWNNRPGRTSAARDDKGPIPTGSWVEWDVTPFVTGNGTYSFTLAQTTSDGADFRAREYAINRPQLVVTLP